MVSIRKFAVFLILPVLFFANMHAHFTIEIEPSELQSIGQVLVESYFHHNLIQRKPSIQNSILVHIKKCSLSFFQLVGITASLVGANILTPLFQEKFEFTLTTTATQRANSTVAPSKICPHDFGCDRNICWRTCNRSEKENDVFTWCYTKSSPDSHKYVQCTHPHDCSACWDCLGRCHSKVH